MLKRLLFETQVGEWILAQFERFTGLAVILVEDLEQQTAAVH